MFTERILAQLAWHGDDERESLHCLPQLFDHQRPPPTITSERTREFSHVEGFDWWLGARSSSALG